MSWEEYLGELQILLETLLDSEVLLGTQEIFSLECLTQRKSQELKV